MGADDDKPPPSTPTTPYSEWRAVPDDAETSVVANKLGWLADWMCHKSAEWQIERVQHTLKARCCRATARRRVSRRDGCISAPADY